MVSTLLVVIVTHSGNPDSSTSIKRRTDGWRLLNSSEIWVLTDQNECLLAPKMLLLVVGVARTWNYWGIYTAVDPVAFCFHHPIIGWGFGPFEGIPNDGPYSIHPMFWPWHILIIRVVITLSDSHIAPFLLPRRPTGSQRNGSRFYGARSFIGGSMQGMVVPKNDAEK